MKPFKHSRDKANKNHVLFIRLMELSRLDYIFENFTNFLYDLFLEIF